MGTIQILFVMFFAYMTRETMTQKTLLKEVKEDLEFEDLVPN